MGAFASGVPARPRRRAYLPPADHLAPRGHRRSAVRRGLRTFRASGPEMIGGRQPFASSVKVDPVLCKRSTTSYAKGRIVTPHTAAMACDTRLCFSTPTPHYTDCHVCAPRRVAPPDRLLPRGAGRLGAQRCASAYSAAHDATGLCLRLDRLVQRSCGSFDHPEHLEGFGRDEP